MSNRTILAIATGMLLGIFCIIGVGLRLGFSGNEVFLFATWFNRVVMGLMIGLAGGLQIIKGKQNYLIRGLILGAVVSFALFVDTEFRDLTGFFAGLAYGVIIDFVATRFSKK